MAYPFDISGKCTKKIKKRACGGKVVVVRSQVPGLIGPGIPMGYECSKCKTSYSFPPVPNIRIPKFRKKITRPTSQ